MMLYLQLYIAIDFNLTIARRAYLTSQTKNQQAN
jgi:hypothetical protein